jgi:hypothetical protein
VRAVSPVVFALALLLLAGCGTSGREDEIRAVAERFATAVDAGDGAAACALLTAPAREKLASDERRPCAEAVTGLDVKPSPVDKVSVAITSASAHYAGGGTLFLDETTHGWRIAAAACEAKPDDQPYDCELDV